MAERAPEKREVTGSTPVPATKKVPLSEAPEHDDFHVSETHPASTLLDAYRHQARTAIALVRDLPLHTPPAWWPDDMFGDWRLRNLQEVLMHVLIETTCHAGHLDAARELIDGRTWDYARRRLSDPP